MKILGIDPGTHKTGWGVIKKEGNKVSHVDNGLIVPKASLPLAARLLFIFNELVKVIDNFKPEAASVEEVFVAKSAKSALVLGHARGVALLAASRANLEISEYSTRVIKQAVVGYGNAEKIQVAQMVKALLKLPEIAAEDASDALAAAICHAQVASSPLAQFKVK